MSKWWQNRVIYQIYPRSFCDSNNDGIGDIPGIISKLDYLKTLGVGALWLSPVYVSPNRDYGYDVADYCDINPEYGTMADMKELLREAKRHDVKIIMDLVINHTSDEHRWFKASRDPASIYRDYYIWQQPHIGKNGKESPPNNWTSFFTGPAWTKDERSGEYYLHLFSKHQPDLNFRNPAVIAEVKNIMRFWLDLGVAGFRCDVINLIYKESFDDGERKFLATGSEHYLSTPGCHALMQQFNTEIWKPYNAFIIGEIHNGNVEAVKEFVIGKELTMGFAFEHMVFKLGYTSEKVKQSLIKWQQRLDWNPVFFENHDGMRSVSRFGDDGRFHRESATMLATLLFTLRGTPFIYQGQEIGMTNVPFENMEQIEDVVSERVYELLTKFHLPAWLAFKLIMYLSRDHARTPMQWDSSVGAGFTSHKTPWLMINPNHKTINIKQSMANESSVWNYYAKLIELRKDSSALKEGDIHFLPSDKGVLAFERIEKQERYRIVVNMDGKKRKAGVELNGSVVISNYAVYDYRQSNDLRPYEAMVLQLE